MTLFAKLHSQTVDLPEVLQEPARQFCAELASKLEYEKLSPFRIPIFTASILKVCTCSRFVSESWLRQPELLPELFHSGDLFSTRRRHDYAVDLSLQNINSEAELGKQLRLFRRREMVRIAWRDLAGWADLNETLADLTALAETCIAAALDFLYRQACQRWGIPTLTDGSPFNLVVLGMGKLGAWELNFSSDIDLIFAYAEDGLLTEKKEISYSEFFSRITRNLVKILDEITVDGFVFRTDIRLRPFGDSGPLTMSFDGMEHYYQTQAREWERYAMIKARQVAGDTRSGQQLAAMIKPFVYRRYLDYGAFEELRSLKLQIMQELKRKDKLENVKLGPGGIREVEFIGQAFQLIRGGREPVLQQREIQAVLTALGDIGLMAPADAAELIADYRFLRRVENHIQQYQDRQSHDLPIDASGREILAYSMNFSGWQSFKQQLDAVRERVHSHFCEVFSLDLQDSTQQKQTLLWVANAGDEQSLQLLRKQGYSDPAAILQAIADFRANPALKRLTRKGLSVVQRLIPLLLEKLAAVDNQQQTLERILALIIAVTGRNVYLSLLTENPDALSQLIRLSAASPWICQFLARYPILFDELLDVRRLYEPLNKAALAQNLQRELDKIDALDDEQLMIALRQFRHLNVLRVAAADIMGVIPVMVVSDYLTWIAETILEQVWRQAWMILGHKYGFPPGASLAAPDFAIIGFGKLGGMELGYASDLDLVFIYNCPDDNAATNGDQPINCGQFYLRLAQKIRHILDTRMLSGVLYEVDMRLRPNGDSGLLVSHIHYYEDYLQHHAWTWEHQALVRARFITGDSALHTAFSNIRQRILALPRDTAVLKGEVRDMREKMRHSLCKTGPLFDLKQGHGGVADIEFMVQYGILAETAAHPGLCHYTDSVRLLDGLRQLGFIAEADAVLLKQAYCSYRDYGHHRILQGHDATAAETEFAELKENVIRIWQGLML